MIGQEMKYLIKAHEKRIQRRYERLRAASSLLEVSTMPSLAATSFF